MSVHILASAAVIGVVAFCPVGDRRPGGPPPGLPVPAAGRADGGTGAHCHRCEDPHRAPVGGLSMGIWEQLGLDMARHRMVALVGAGGQDLHPVCPWPGRRRTAGGRWWSLPPPTFCATPACPWWRSRRRSACGPPWKGTGWSPWGRSSGGQALRRGNSGGAAPGGRCGTGGGRRGQAPAPQGPGGARAGDPPLRRRRGRRGGHGRGGTGRGGGLPPA